MARPQGQRGVRVKCPHCDDFEGFGPGDRVYPAVNEHVRIEHHEQWVQTEQLGRSFEGMLSLLAPRAEGMEPRPWEVER